MEECRATTALVGGLLLAAQAQALQIVSFSPQGEVAQARQAVAKFDAAAVTFGDPKAPAPLAISCNDAAASKGTGRWTSEREWVFDFEADLPRACAARPPSNLSSNQPLALC